MSLITSKPTSGIVLSFLMRDYLGLACGLLSVIIVMKPVTTWQADFLLIWGLCFLIALAKLKCLRFNFLTAVLHYSCRLARSVAVYLILSFLEWALAIKIQVVAGLCILSLWPQQLKILASFKRKYVYININIQRCKLSKLSKLFSIWSVWKCCVSDYPVRSKMK